MKYIYIYIYINIYIYMENSDNYPGTSCIAKPADYDLSCR